MNRLFRLCITCCFVFVLACGGNNDNNSNGDTNNDTNNATNNATNNPTNNDPNNGETNNDPNNGETNNDTNVQTTQCDAAGDACVEGEDTNVGFVCVDSECRQECDLQAPEEGCRSGAICLPVSEGGPGYCQPSNCTGYLDDTSCAADEQCAAARNDAFICFPAGSIQEGAACEATDMEPFPCAPGNFCVFGVCEALCGGDGDCSGDKSCVDDSLVNGVGFCGDACTSYSEGECGDGQGCVPITADEGICDDVGTTGYYQECDPAAAEPECGENSACITFQGDPNPVVARCLPFCNPAAPSQGAADDTCPDPSAGGYARFVHLAEGAGQIDVYVDDNLAVDDLSFEDASDAGAFMELAVGQHTIDITAFDAADNSAPLLTLTPDVAAGDALTWGIVPDPADTIQAVTLDVPRGEAAPAAGDAKLRAAHAIPDFGSNADVVAVPAGALDFSNETEIALDIAFGEAGGFVELAADSYDVYIFPAGTAPRTVVNATGVTISDVAVAADSTATLYARGTTDGADAADPGLTSLDYVSAPSGRVLGGSCLDLSGGNPRPGSGVCLESCPDSDTYGTGACSGPSDYCSPSSGGGSLCFPGGPNTSGEACNPDDSSDGCDGVSWCQGYGDGSGQCAGFCQPDTQSNPELGCAGTESCAEVGTNLGRCRLECTPDADFADTTTCPEFLQTCHPPDIGEPGYCGASGDKAIGDPCAVFEGECGPGDSCVNYFAATLDFQSQEQAVEDGACAASCDPFGDGSDCDGGDVCAVNWLTISRAVGHCVTPDEDLNRNDPCQAEYNICGNRSLCLDVGMGAQCIQMCDLDDASTCAGNCMSIFNSAEIRIGACI